jgi:AAA15 family ATPase/GTPase
VFINEVQVRNFRLFPPSEPSFAVKLEIPDNHNPGSGLTAFVGENGCGKTALLDSIALPLVSYKAEGLTLEDFNDPKIGIEIKVFSQSHFDVDGTMPKGSFPAKGLMFKAGIRSKGSKAYLSSIIVSDQLFIKAGEKPKDGSPDLRVSVNNPFKGRRFDENDVLFLDKGRTNQTRLGTFNSTRFNRLMEDLDFQYICAQKSGVPSIQKLLDPVRDSTSNAFLEQAVEKFREISGNELSLSLIDNWNPFSNAFLAVNKGNNQQIPLHMLGSGYEMIFSLLLSFYLSQQSGKQLICLIDEPELHLHPSLQEKFVKIAVELSKNIQIILSTHSPLLIKQLSARKALGIQILRRDQDVPLSVPMSEAVLPYSSSNEINYLAFGLATTEYHDELYGHIQESQQKYTEGEMCSYLNAKGQKSTRKWNPEKSGAPTGVKDVPLQVFIRNKIHHPENKTMQNSACSYEELRQSIDAMIGIIKNP